MLDRESARKEAKRRSAPRIRTLGPNPNQAVKADSGLNSTRIHLELEMLGSISASLTEPPMHSPTIVAASSARAR